MEPVAHLHVDLPRIGVVGTAEGGAVVEKESAIRHVQRCQGNGDSLRKRPSERKIKAGVLRQMGRNVARPVGESRSVVQIAARGDVAPSPSSPAEER